MNIQLPIPAGLGGAESLESLKVFNSNFQFNYWIIHPPNCFESSEVDFKVSNFRNNSASKPWGYFLVSFWVFFWVHFGVHVGVIFGSVPGSLLGSALEHLLHQNTSKTKRFWCFGGFGKGLISGHVPVPFQGTFLVIILVRFGDNFLTASLGLATPGFHVKLDFELSQ